MDEMLSVTLGDRRYRIERPWGRLPEGMAIGHISQIAADSKGRVYLFRRADPPVLVFEADGSYRGAWGEGLVADAHGIAITPDDRILLVDRDAHQVMAFDTDGRELFRLGERHRPRQGAPFNHPTDIAVAPSGDFYVSDGYGNTNVHRFDAAGRHVGTWGRPGSGPGEFTTPHGIWVTADGRVVVGDRENDRIQVFSAEGEFLAIWTGVHRPMDIWGDPEGRIYVTDHVPALVCWQDDGTPVGRCRPVWNGAHGLWGDPAGNIYLAEQQPARITRMVPVS